MILSPELKIPGFVLCFLVKFTGSLKSLNAFFLCLSAIEFGNANLIREISEASQLVYVAEPQSSLDNICAQKLPYTPASFLYSDTKKFLYKS